MKPEQRPALNGVPAAPADPHRWKALGVLAAMQFLLVLDLTVVNIALPRIGTDLDLGPAHLVWVVDAYALTAGGLLLLGGRIADLVGRRRMFFTGVIVFAAGSMVAGLAPAGWVLVTGRVIQGMGDAIAAPAALALIVVLFPETTERAKAFGIWGVLAGIGGVTGTVISGVLTDVLNWRYVFLLAVPVALLVVLLGPRLLSESRMTQATRPEFSGVLAGTIGLAAVIYALLKASEDGWATPEVAVPLAVGALLLVLMFLVEARSRRPLIPLAFFAHRTRLTANAVTLVNAAAFGSFLFILSLYLQGTLHYTPLTAGLAYLPIGIAIGAGLAFGSVLIPRLGLRTILTAGCAVTAVGLGLTAVLLAPDASYWSQVVPSMAVVGLGQGILMPTMTTAALSGVSEQDAGLGSGIQATMTHAGAALGLAIFVSIAVQYASDVGAAGTSPGEAELAGFGCALVIASLSMALAGVGATALVEKSAAQPISAEGP
ncbi:MFS transporter [Arthrobacter sp. zg-Y820]|uniref:MFS transporter n=1 Tax=unclassified Arthrobacter TaxID=235627 RepID=UPI001E2DFB44|nr:MULTISPECIES: MFS transporter [unclassified Arthrobacter]MCC9197663.1 MFS transporter [Arthrobacter sp. zg-Y820]MDK1280530.1 MFS transporter [Arthrobacter sp. zg.Y820]WIB10831.1 MFS transporter [Arthrobacter sp. zg-Y820]